MKKSLSKVVLMGSIVGSAVFFFQNCGQNKFETQNESLIMPTAETNQAVVGQSNTTTNSNTGNGGITPSNPGIPSPSNTNTNTNTGTGTNTGTATGNGSVGGTPTTSTVSCGTVMSKLGWNSSSFVRVDFRPADNMGMSQSTEYAYDGFGISFNSESNQATFVERFRMDDSGLQIRIKNKTNGQVISIANSSYKTISSMTSNHAGASVIQTSTGNRASLNIHVSRSFYESFKNQLGEVEVEIVCDGTAGPKASQDFKALSPDLDRQMIKSSVGYTYKPGTPFGFAHLECVEEIATGGQVDCHVGGVSIDRIRWFADYQEYPDLANLAAIKGGSVTTGLHYVQAIVTYKDGSTGPTLMRFIRAQ